MTTSTSQHTAFQVYITISGMADQASRVANELQPGSLEWEKAYAKSFALRDAAIKILEDHCNA